MTIAWPSDLRLLDCQPELRNFAKSGGVTVTGRQQRVFSDAGVWEVAVRVMIRKRQHANAYKALIARLRAGEDILLKVQDQARPIGSGESAATAQLGGAVALRATAATINTNGIVLEAGHHFSISGRLYRITGITSEPGTDPTLKPWASDNPWCQATPWQNGVDSTGTYNVAFLPPARQAYAGGTLIQTKDMTLRCVIKDLADGDMQLAVGRLGDPTITFIES